MPARTQREIAVPLERGTRLRLDLPTLWEVPAAKPLYGVLNFDGSAVRSEEARKLIALLVLVAGLAAATISFVVLPMFDRPSGAPQACEMFVLTKSGVTRCVPETPPGTPIAHAAS